MGLAVGFISGMFGIGGGFLMTPLLIFLGISPAVAVASVTGHIAASSMSGAVSYWRRRAIDLALAFMLLAGGIVGTAFGVWFFTMLRAIGQLDITIGLSYVVLLGIVGALMVTESVRGKASRSSYAGLVAILGSMAYRSSCASNARAFMSPRSPSWESDLSSASSELSWASAVASYWCPC